MRNNRRGDVSRRGFLLAVGAAAGTVAASVSGQAPAESRGPTEPVESPATEGHGRAVPRMKIAEMLPPTPGPLFRLVKQCGVDHAVATLARRPAADTVADDAGSGPPWSRPALERAKKIYGEAGFELAVIEWRPPLTRAKLGLPGRDEEIDTVCELIRNMGCWAFRCGVTNGWSWACCGHRLRFRRAAAPW